MKEESFKTHWTPIVALALVFSLALALRLLGFTWGVPTANAPHPPFMVDEIGIMRATLEVDPWQGRFYATAAGFEGVFLPQLVGSIHGLLRGLGYLSGGAEAGRYDQDYGAVLLLGRGVVVGFGLFITAVIIIFIRYLTGNLWTALAGGLAWAVMPFAAIYGQWYRNHIPASGFTLLCLVGCVVMAREPRFVYHGAILAGASASLATVTRWSSLIPCLGLVAALAWTALRERKLFPVPLAALGVLGLSSVVTFLVICPNPFVAIEGVMSQMRYSEAAQFQGAGALDLSRLAMAIGYLYHWCGYPILGYALLLGCLGLGGRALAPFPGCAISALLLGTYFMSKGYTQGRYARAMADMLPILIVAGTIGLGRIYELLRSRQRWLARSLQCGVGTAVLASALFSSVYGLGIRELDPRLRLLDSLINDPSCSKISLNLPLRFPYDLVVRVLSAANGAKFTVDGTLDPNNINHRFQGTFVRTDAAKDEPIGPNCSFVLDVNIAPAGFGEVLAKAQNIPGSKIFMTELNALGMTVSYQDMPHDLRYPLPVIALVPTQNPSP